MSKDIGVRRRERSTSLARYPTRVWVVPAVDSEAACTLYIYESEGTDIGDDEASHQNKAGPNTPNTELATTMLSILYGLAGNPSRNRKDRS